MDHQGIKIYILCSLRLNRITCKKIYMHGNIQTSPLVQTQTVKKEAIIKSGQDSSKQQRCSRSRTTHQAPLADPLKCSLGRGHVATGDSAWTDTSIGSHGDWHAAKMNNDCQMATGATGLGQYARLLPRREGAPTRGQDPLRQCGRGGAPR